MPEVPRRIALSVLLDHPVPATSGLHMRMVGNLHAVGAVAERSVVLWFSTSDRPSSEVGELERYSDEARCAGPRVEETALSVLERVSQKARLVLVAATGRPRSSYPFSHRYDLADAAQIIAEHADDIRADVVVLPSQGMHWMEALPAGTDVVIDAADVLSDVTRRLAATSTAGPLRRLGLWVNHLACKNQERTYLPRAAEVWVTSPAEANRVAAIAPGARPLVVPNTTVGSTPTGPSTGHLGAVGIVATWSYRPNLDALDRLLDGVLPRLIESGSDIRLVVAGRDLPDDHRRRCEAHPQIDLVGEVPQIDDFYSRIDAVALPIDVRGGVPLKLVEALSRAVPVVASPALVDGVDVRHGVDLLVARSDEEFADSIAALVGDDTLRRALGESGRVAWQRLFSPRARDGAVAGGSVLCR